MRSLVFYLLPVIVLSASTACTKDQPDGDHAADINFRTDSGYTFLNDTVPLSDTLHIGVSVSKGSDNLRSFFVAVAYDNGPRIRQDSVHVDSDPFTFEKTVITRDQAGTEKWWFSVDENDGDITQQALTLTVQ
ncbi:MAG: hypothetical protein IPO60_03150 [Flavobacteriales bacterium]|nr:hypothetical protein [Flavobacteriales bacterium]